MQRFQRPVVRLGTVRDTTYSKPYVQELLLARTVTVQGDGEGAVVRLGTVYGPGLSDFSWASWGSRVRPKKVYTDDCLVL